VKRFSAIALLLLAVPLACTEVATAPGVCPTFCPDGTIESADTIFTDIIVRDSSFRGYVQAYQAEAMTAADIPGVIDSRAFFVLNNMTTRTTFRAGDTTTVPIVPDSARLRTILVRRDTLATNLRLNLYRLPVTADSNDTFASLDPYFATPPVDSVNISAILARPPITDTATRRIWGDSIWTDSAGHVITLADEGRILALYWDLDTLQAPLVEADSGSLAYGVRVAADSLATVAIGTLESPGNALFTWFYHYTVPDTVTTEPDSVKSASALRAPRFDSFVFDRPVEPLDSNLVVGGAPSARSLLRVDLPEFLHDSIDVVRATLILVPVAPVPASPADSFEIRGLPVTTDVGAKSPLALVLTGTTTIHPQTPDTVRMELTDLVRNWALDSTQTTAFMLGQVPEAASYTEIRFYSSRAAAFRPALHVTYVKRYPFGKP
jgi:hypothetical protein